MTLLRDHDLARAFDHASHSYDRLTALNPGYRADLDRSARRLRLPDGGAGLHV
ncbi:ubiquinone biosynthesis methyltransferase UbiE, partial [Streptomyces sp. SID5998]|nr:ubiquinone biosynthesis methyltransferase UbiE [Streptomyces sp. SID5998]